MNPTLYVNKYEVAIFPKDFYSSDLTALLADLENEIEVFNDGNNLILPIPAEVPREVPRIILKSKDGVVKCDLAFDKINISWINVKEESTFSIDLDVILQTVESLSKVILSHTPPPNKMKRVGYIKEVFFVSSDPSKAIAGSIINKKLTTNLRNYIFRFTNDIKINNKNCNEVVTIGDGTTSGKKQKVVMFSKDLNTLQNIDVNFDLSKIKDFIKEADQKLDKKEIYSSFFKS